MTLQERLDWGLPPTGTTSRARTSVAAPHSYRPNVSVEKPLGADRADLSGKSSVTAIVEPRDYDVET